MQSNGMTVSQSLEVTATIAANVLTWFDHQGRHDLPWQADKRPYSTWVSEIMLQQTQVNTVIPYYQRFMDAFPDVYQLANAPLDKVLHHWTGLGYYARARHLHKTAQIILHDHQGEFPDTVEALSQLPGIGRSTAGAIVSIAFQKKATILDGNVKRVLSRYHGVEGWTGSTIVLKHLWQLADQHTPDQRCGDYTQAIMDLGATICQRKNPNCNACPLQDTCQAFLSNSTDRIPAPKPKKTLPIKTTNLYIFLNTQGEVALYKRPQQGIWGGLWSFPATLNPHCCEQNMTMMSAKKHIFSPLRHTFSHYHLDINAIVYQLPPQADLSRITCCFENERTASPGVQELDTLWYNVNQPNHLIGLAAPIKRLMQQIQREFYDTTCFLP